MAEHKWDILCMGRAAVDFYADQYGARLEDASSFSKYVGGCPANVAVGCARLGLKSAMLTRVGDEANGRFVRETLQKEGVDVSLVHTDEERLTGMVLLGVAPPDQFPLIFYRENCADMALEADDFCREDIAAAGALLLTGTHFSQPQAKMMSLHAAKIAHEVGTPIVLDIDYRPVLWGVAGHGEGDARYVDTSKVAEALRDVLPLCSLIVGTEEELRIAADEAGVNKAIDSLRHQTASAIVLKRGPEGCSVFPAAADTALNCPGFPTEVLNVLGAGDAFLAGLLRGWLKGEDWEVSAAWANACGSLVVGRHGCAPAIPYWQELNAFMDASLNAAEIEVLHQSLNRRQHPKTPLYVLAFDHHDAFEEWESVLAPAQIQSLKRLIYGSLEQLHLRMEDTAFGLIIDDRYGSEVLSACEGKGLWIARAWKSPLLERGSVGAAQDPALAFRNWPRHHVVKILWRPEPASRSRQLRELFKVHEAATAWGLELLIEVIRPEQERHDLLQDMRDVYSKGIQVAWWKLPPYQDPVWWADCRKLIADEDPMSHGVLALGQGLAPAELLTRLRELRAVHAIEGCAVGRSFWLDPCRRYMRGEMTERECEKAIAQLVSGFVEGLSHESIKGG